MHNFARSAQAVELDLSEFKGRLPEEMFGRTRFPAIGELPYLLTLTQRGRFLGGGVTAGDGLETFKRGFANAELPFRTHELVCDQGEYERLAELVD